jgi:hypothetical protein
MNPDYAQLLIDPSVLALDPETPPLPLWFKLSVGAFVSLLTALVLSLG